MPAGALMHGLASLDLPCKHADSRTTNPHKRARQGTEVPDKALIWCKYFIDKSALSLFALYLCIARPICATEVRNKNSRCA